MKETKEINNFADENKFLSNFYLSPITFNGITYASAEAAFQAQKTEDEDERQKFVHLSPAKSKQYGRQLALRENWDTMKDNVMLAVLLEKFKNPVLAKKLKNTYPAKLVEGNWWGDTYWGRCNGEGKNILGVLLMQVRRQLMGVDF